jgi:hypothetical protein
MFQEFVRLIETIAIVAFGKAGKSGKADGRRKRNVPSDLMPYLRGGRC